MDAGLPPVVIDWQIGCDGPCQGWFRGVDVGIVTPEQQAAAETPGAEWRCAACLTILGEQQHAAQLQLQQQQYTGAQHGSRQQKQPQQQRQPQQPQQPYQEQAPVSAASASERAAGPKAHAVQLKKLEQQVAKAGGDGARLTEAQVEFKTNSFRRCSEQRFGEALELLRVGAALLLQRGRVELGTELGQLYIKTLEQADEAVSEENVGGIVAIAGAYPAAGAASSRLEVGKITLLRDGVLWTSRKAAGGAGQGAPVLHTLLAQSYWREQVRYPPTLAVNP